MIFSNKWARRYISRRWGPGILTKVDSDTNEIQSEFSEKKAADYVLLADMNSEYTQEVTKWFQENGLPLSVISKTRKRKDGDITEEDIRYGINLIDFKAWLKWKLGLSKSKEKPQGIPKPI